MASIEWFYAKDNKRLGPVSPAELRQLVLRGELKGDDLVWRYGMNDWTAARRVKGLFEDVSDASAEIDVATRPGEVGQGTRAAFEWSAVYRRIRDQSSHHVFDYLLDFARSHFTAQFVDTTSSLFAGCGYYVLYATIVVAAVYALAAAVRGVGASQAALAALAIPALVVLQYVAGRFLEALERLNRVTPGRLTSSAVTDSFALISFFAGATGLLGLTILGVQSQRLDWIIPALAAFILCQYAASIAINPQSVYVTITTTAGAGEEALGIVSFFLKVAMQTVPVAFGVGVVWGTARLAFVAFQAVTAPEEALVPVAIDAWEAAVVLFGAALLPLAAYVVFLMAHLSIDVLRGIVSLARLADKPTDDGQPERS